MSEPTNSNQFQPTNDLNEKNGLNDLNGDLPPARLAIVEQGNRIHQEVAHERDMLRLEVAALKSDLAASRVVAEALQAQVTQAESRLETARLERQEAVDQIAPFRVLFQGAVALMRAFEIEHEPLIRDRDEAMRQQAEAQTGVGRNQYGALSGRFSMVGGGVARQKADWEPGS